MKDAARLERAKADSTLQLLFRAARLTNEEAVERVRRETGAKVRAAHTLLLPHVDLEGTRLTELARRLGVTKQATMVLVDELSELGLLERVPDPRDARAKLVRFSKEGRRRIFAGLAVLGALESELAREIGEDRMKDLRRALERLVPALERRARPPRA